MPGIVFDIKIHTVFRAFVQKLMLFGFCGYFHSKNKRQNIQASASTDTIILSMDFLRNCGGFPQQWLNMIHEKIML